MVTIIHFMNVFWSVVLVIYMKEKLIRRNFMLNLRDYYEVSYMLFNIHDFIVILISLYLLYSLMNYDIFPFLLVRNKRCIFRTYTSGETYITSSEDSEARAWNLKKWVNRFLLLCFCLPDFWVVSFLSVQTGCCCWQNVSAVSKENRFWCWLWS